MWSFDSWHQVKFVSRGYGRKISLHGSNEHLSSGTYRTRGFCSTQWQWNIASSCGQLPLPLSWKPFQQTSKTQNLSGEGFSWHSKGHISHDFPWHSTSASFTAILWATVVLPKEAGISAWDVGGNRDSLVLPQP